MSVPEVVAQYKTRIVQLQEEIDQVRGPSAVALIVAVIAAVLFLALGLSAIRQEISFVVPLLTVPVFVFMLRRFLALQRKISRLVRSRTYYDRSIERVNGNWVRTGISGEEYVQPDHVFAHDLNVFGVGSLFELLCTVRTTIGQRGLADYLLGSPSLGEVMLRQQAIRELRERADLREAVATLGDYDFLQSSRQTFDEWLETEPIAFAPWLRWVCAFTVVLAAAVLVAGATSLVSWNQVAILALPLAVFHAAVGLFYQERVNEMIASLRPMFQQTRVLGEGLALLEGMEVQSTKLRAIVEGVRGSGAAIARLEPLLAVLEQRDKEAFYLPTRAVLAGTQVCMLAERWRQLHGGHLREWLQAWADFEALNALATYAFENPTAIFPEFVDGPAFAATGLGHPLLPGAACVTNDVALTPFYVVSGSNMSGKSTLLRSIGLNGVLAFAGAPVRATAMRLSRLSIVASLSVGDSLLNGKSKFMAEVDRLRQALELAAGKTPVLFLVDEIFSGTNSRDRRVAAEAVVRTLIERGAIGALSTHDLALTEIAGVLGGANVHMGSKDGSDPMDFDYRLKSGVTTEANALAIARMAGVPV